MPAGEIMRKFYDGTLKSGSGAKVTSLAQARAIAVQYTGKGEEKRKPKKKGTKHDKSD